MKPLDYACLTTRAGAPVMLEAVHVEGDLRGLLFEARVEQRFCNPTDRGVEVAYTFPLPWGAVLMGIEVQLGSKHLNGGVVAKKWAEARYEEALSEGDAAIMLEKNHDLSYTLNLGNLAAQERCVITMRYAQTLQFEQGGLRLLIPTVIAPRFGDAVIEGGLMPHLAPVHSLLVQYPFHIALRLHGDLARARVTSPSHPVTLAHTPSHGSGDEGDGGSVLTACLGRSAWLDRDFVLVIDQLAHDSLAVLARDRVEPDGLAVLASFCPRIPAQGPAVTAVKILVDCSGSMAGDSIEAARRALHAIVEQFGPDDRFSLSRFGSTVEHRSRGLWSVREATRLAAQRWVQDLRADLGGTNMESALDATFNLAQTVPSDVLLVTDGEISAIDSTIAAARASGHRVFVVGIGSAPAEGHLRRLAQATGGACDFVAPGEAVEPAVLRMFARLRSPALSDVHLVWPEGITPWWASPVPMSVFEGDTVSVYALLKGDMPGALRLVGRTSADADPVDIGCALLSSQVGTGDTLPRMAAASRMTPGVDDALGVPPSFLTKIAVDYQLVTDQTSFLLVHERAEEDKANDMPELHKVSQMLAAGWSGVGTCGGVEPDATYRVNVDASVRLCAMDTSGAFDAPAFSRSQGSVPAVYRTRRAEPKVPKAGDTPMALCAWLRSTPESGWPATYDGLRQIGLDRCVIDWLELSMAPACDGAVTEQVVVRSFLFVMARQETLDALNALSPGDQGAPGKKGLMRKLAGLFTAVHGQRRLGVDEPLVEKMVLALHGMTADHWPDTVYALDAQAAVAEGVPVSKAPDSCDAHFKQALPMKG
jgi:Ca-activated chloride channel family protein